MRRILVALFALAVATGAFADGIFNPGAGGIGDNTFGGLLGGAGTPSAWTPLNLGSALLAWWDAQNTANITFNGSTVAAWFDSKNHLGAFQAATASQPTYSATARNGKPGLSFAQSPVNTLIFDPVSGGFPSGSSASTIAIAAYTSVVPATATQQFVFGYGPAVTTAGQSRVMGQAATTDPTSGVPFFGTSGAGGNDYASAESWENVDRFVVSQLSGQSSNLNVDGNATESATLTPTTNTVLTTNFGAIGQWREFGNAWLGVVQQVVVLNALLDTNQRQCLEGWESWHDGKAGSNLPVSHPYKSAAPTTSSNCS